MMTGFRMNLAPLLAAVSGLALASCASTGEVGRLDTFAVGADVNGDPCTALPNWTERDDFIAARSVYSVNCRGAVAGTSGRIRHFDSPADRAAASAQLQCGNEMAIDPMGFDGATARRCYDPALSAQTVVIDAELGSAAYQVSAAPNSVAPAFNGALVLAGLRAPGSEATMAPLDFAALSLPEVAGAASDGSGAGIESEALLSLATNLNIRGLHADSARLLRGELVNLPADTSAEVRAALLLESALAESSIQFFETADRNLAAAEALIEGLGSARLEEQLRLYRGLDLLNRREFAEAAQALASLIDNRASEASLQEPATLMKLNQLAIGRGDLRSSVAFSSADLEEQSRQRFRRVLGIWAKSVAEATLGNTGEARESILIARSELEELRRDLQGSKRDDTGLYWLEARVLRQLARVEAKGENYGEAIEVFDEALDLLTLSSRAQAGSSQDPVVAEFLLERASLVLRQGKPQVEVDAAYSEAVDALIEAREDSPGTASAFLQPRLDQLAERSRAGEKDAAERFFKILQISGESGAAQQMSELQEVVAEDAGYASKLRDRQDLRREITALSIDIADRSANPAAGTAEALEALRARRSQAQSDLANLEAELASNGDLARVSLEPASIEELQASLQPREAYARFAVIGDRVFGMLVENDRVQVIAPEQSASYFQDLAGEVRETIKLTVLSGGRTALKPFDVDNAAKIFDGLFGSVADSVRAQEEMVVDAGAVLGNLPPSILVADKDRWTGLLPRQNAIDYSGIEFLANLMPTSVATSPRSFIVSRSFAQTTANRDFIGFASPAGVDPGIAQQVDASYRVGPCRMTGPQLAAFSATLAPLDARDVTAAVRALNLGPDPRIIAGAAFTDTALDLMSDDGADSLSNYKVLHFSSHGLTEGALDCPDSPAKTPAAILTSLDTRGASDTLLSFDEIARLKLNANLVVLAACETASATGERAQLRAGDARPGDSLTGLVRAFIAAGSRAVMATYWPIPDGERAETFMSAFYGAARANTLSGALNVAHREVLGNPRTSHPYYWGAYFIVGDTDNRMLEGGSDKPDAMAYNAR
jgi:hypothetical protein